MYEVLVDKTLNLEQIDIKMSCVVLWQCSVKLGQLGFREYTRVSMVDYMIKFVQICTVSDLINAPL